VDPEGFAPLPEATAAVWGRFGQWQRTFFPKLVGVVVEEVRTDYCRMRLPYRPELDQPHGLVHGGAIATLLDSVVVPAIGSAYDLDARFSTVSMHVDFLGAVKGEDVVAVGWVVQRGRTIVFCRAEAGTDGGRQVASASLVYRVSPPGG
jgi:uncharacterized protein (TIGR00369 family)